MGTNQQNNFPKNGKYLLSLQTIPHCGNSKILGKTSPQPSEDYSENRQTLRRLRRMESDIQRNVHRAYIGLIPVLVVSFFGFRQVRLSQGETPELAVIEVLLIVLLQIGVTIRIITLASRSGELSGTR